MINAFKPLSLWFVWNPTFFFLKKTIKEVNHFQDSVFLKHLVHVTSKNQVPKNVSECAYHNIVYFFPLQTKLQGFFGGLGVGEIMKNHTVCSSIVVHFCLGHKFETKRQSYRIPIPIYVELYADRLAEPKHRPRLWNARTRHMFNI